MSNLTPEEETSCDHLGRLMARVFFPIVENQYFENKLARHEKSIERFKAENSQHNRGSKCMGSVGPVSIGSDNDNQNND